MRTSSWNVLQQRQTLQSRSAVLALLAFLTSACTGQLPNSFRYAQQDESFSTSQDVNTKVDILWVVDNSASMDVSQKTLRDGFRAFATKYMKPTWDIRVAAITTDTYLAHPAFSNYLAAGYQGSGYNSTYYGNTLSNPPGGTAAQINPHTGPFVDPSYPSWTAGTISNTGRFTRTTTVSQMFPSWGAKWGMLLPGGHDGPMVSLCYEQNSYFFWGESQCFVRDNGSNRGPSHCLNPQGAEDSTTQCVNTFMNDTIHSNQPIVTTLPPAGTAGDAAWVDALTSNFMLNLSTGSSGSGSERGFGSVLQLLKDNEDATTRKAQANPLFRQNSLRVIVFVTDEDDQTISLDASDALDPAPLAPTSPFSGYITAQAGCPITAGSPQTANCCATKTVDGYTYTIPVCPKGYPAAEAPTAGAVLMPVAHVKTKFDQFFQNLDGLAAAPATPSYFVASVVLVNGASIQALREQKRCPEQQLIFGSCDSRRDASSDRGDRYIGLSNLVGNGSFAMDLSVSDYTPILNALGQSILLKKSTFTLQRAPTGYEEMILSVVHADGSRTVVQPSQYTITGNVITITDQNLVLNLGATDKINVNYQPKTAG